MATASFSCLCGRVNSTVRLSNDFTTEAFFCHRSRCRYNLGALFHCAVPISAEGRPAQVELLESFTNSEDEHGTVRYFCGTCGSHVFELDQGWKIQSGVITGVQSEQVLGALDDIFAQRYVHEARDGGLASCFQADVGAWNEVNSNARFKQQAAAVELETGPKLRDSDSGNDQDHLQAGCACGGVRFYITRPNDSSLEYSSPWPDLIFPFCTHSSDNPNDEKWWIRSDGTRWLAGTCTCRSCRLGLGSPVQAWTFVAKSNIFTQSEGQLTYDFGTLKAFESSPGVRREFCSRCGATAFWHNEERPGVVDVSVGILRAQEGALARSWLSWWTERVSFSEEAFERAFTSRLEAGLHTLADSL